MREEIDSKNNGRNFWRPLYIVLGIIIIAYAGYVFGRWLKDILN